MIFTIKRDGFFHTRLENWIWSCHGMGDIKGGGDRQRRFDDDGWLDESIPPTNWTYKCNSNNQALW